MRLQTLGGKKQVARLQRATVGGKTRHLEIRQRLLGAKPLQQPGQRQRGHV